MADRSSSHRARTNRRSTRRPEEGRGQRLDRQRAGVLRLLHLCAGRRAGLPGPLLPVGQRRRSPSSPRSRRSASATSPVRSVPSSWATSGDKYGRKRSARAVHAADRLPPPSASACCPPTQRWASGADPAGGPAADPGIRGRRRDLRRQRDDPGALAVRPSRLLHQLHPAGRAGRTDSSPPLSSCRCRPSCPRTPSRPGAGGSRSCSARSSCSPVIIIRRKVPRDPGLRGGSRSRRGAAGPDRLGVQGERHRHGSGVLHGADERHPDRGDGIRRHVRDQRRLRRRPDSHELSVDLGLRQHHRRRPDPVRRQPGPTRSAADR